MKSSSNTLTTFHRTSRFSAIVLAGAFMLFATACNKPAEQDKTAASPPATPQKAAANVPHNPLKEAYFGEQHLHTAYSLDAYIGGARLMPADAYRFAKGEAVDVAGVKVQLAKSRSIGLPSPTTPSTWARCIPPWFPGPPATTRTF